MGKGISLGWLSSRGGFGTAVALPALGVLLLIEAVPHAEALAASFNPVTMPLHVPASYSSQRSRSAPSDADSTDVSAVEVSMVPLSMPEPEALAPEPDPSLTATDKPAAHGRGADGKHSRNTGAKIPLHVRPGVQLSKADLCISPGSNFDCARAFAAALNSEASAADIEVSVSGTAEVAGPHGAEPLHFQKRAPWVRRLETLGKEGIPFARIPRGPDSEIVVGINRKGLLGFSLKQTSDR